MPDASPAHDDILSRICADTRTAVAAKQAATGLAEIRRQAAASDRPRGFARALMDVAAAGRPGLIAEIKKASPSGGLIRPDFAPPALAAAYAAGGAACLSVLTEPDYFQGAPAHLHTARRAVTLPVLRKDFILDPWQVYESRAIGADCILLIMAALDDPTARELEDLARGLDMDVLIEVHDEAELDRALGLQSPLLGINNRDLKTLITSLQTTERLARLCPPDRFLISESGIRTAADIAFLRRHGAQGFLVGESLLRNADVAAATRELLTLAA
jgi:indole-3-glycerol phosphate synthase